MMEFKCQTNETSLSFLSILSRKFLSVKYVMSICTLESSLNHSTHILLWSQKTER